MVSQYPLWFAKQEFVYKSPKFLKRKLYQLLSELKYQAYILMLSCQVTLYGRSFRLSISCFILADRLKIPLREVLQMEEWEYNHWLGYLLLEQEEHQKEMNKTRHR